MEPLESAACGHGKTIHVWSMLFKDCFREYDVILWQVSSRVNWGQEGSRHEQTLHEGALPGKRSTPKHNLGGNWEAILISPKRSIFLLTPHFSAHRDSQRYDHLCFIPRSPKTSSKKLGMNFKSCLRFFFCFLMIWYAMPPILYIFSSGTQPCLFIYIMSVAAFSLKGQSGVVPTENVWPTKPKIVTIWPL